MPICPFAKLTICQVATMSICQFDHLTICPFVNLSSCTPICITLPIHHFVKLARIMVALRASAVAICRAGLTYGRLGGILVALGASAVAICRAVCHEGKEFNMAYKG